MSSARGALLVVFSTVLLLAGAQATEDGDGNHNSTGAHPKCADYECPANWEPKPGAENKTYEKPGDYMTCCQEAGIGVKITQDSVKSAAQSIKDDFVWTLTEGVSMSYQWIIATVALGLGLFMMISGDKSYKCVVIIFTAVFCSFVVCGSFEDKNAHFLSVGMGVLSGLIIGAAAWEGFDGMEIAIGVGLGCYLASSITAGLGKLMSGGDNPMVMVWFYIVFALLGGIGCQYRLHHRVLNIVAPIIGSLLMIASCGFLATFGLQELGRKANFEPKLGPWYQFVQMLTSSGVDPDVGVFAGEAGQFSIGKNIHMCWDRVLGQVIWLVMAFCGAAWQIHHARKIAAKKKEEKKAAAKKEKEAGGFLFMKKRKSLEKPLLDEGGEPASNA